jgi:hypothetical protein
MTLPPHKCSLTLCHNNHRDYHEPLEVWFEDNERFQFRDAESRQRAIQSDDIWTLPWYPETPIGLDHRVGHCGAHRMPWQSLHASSLRCEGAFAPPVERWGGRRYHPHSRALTRWAPSASLAPL